MIEWTGNLWDIKADAKCITTNGFVKKNGEAVMGAGIAKQAAKRLPQLPRALGNAISAYGNHVAYLALEWVRPENGKPYEVDYISFPVKHHWKQPADLELIKRSAVELRALADTWKWDSIILPRPGCGNGKRTWAEVKPMIEVYLDERFMVVSYDI